MRAVVQRVRCSSVKIDGKTVGEIGRGLNVLLGISPEDTEKECDFLLDKIVKLRIFGDENGKLNRSLLDVQGELLVISQFTLFADCRHGRRPSFLGAARPETATDNTCTSPTLSTSALRLAPYSSAKRCPSLV